MCSDSTSDTTYTYTHKTVRNSEKLQFIKILSEKDMYTESPPKSENSKITSSHNFFLIVVVARFSCETVLFVKSGSVSAHTNKVHTNKQTVIGI